MSRMMDNLRTASLETSLYELGESITLYPDGVTARAVTALVKRPPPRPMPGSQRHPSQPIEITVINDASLGMTPAEFNAGKTSVDVAVRIGGDVMTIPAKSILEQSSAHLKFSLRSSKTQ